MHDDPAVYISLTLAAAFGFAAAAVLQQAEAAAQENSATGSGGLMRRLMTRPRWWLGMLAYVAAYGLQVWAVSLGPVVIIQPLIAAQLVFALLLGTFFMGRHADFREWLGAIGVTLGLAGFIVGTDPSAGSPDATGLGWAVSTGVTAGLTVLCLFVGARMQGAARSSLYGTAAGLCWGFMIVLMKVLTHRMSEAAGFWGLVEAIAIDPFFYGLLVTAIGGFVLLQKAFAAGSLTHALGAGIEDELLDQVFDPFMSESDEETPGGLGLPVCFRIVEEHGGELRFQPGEDGGARVAFVLPVE